jgi:hypothetical protein
VSVTPTRRTYSIRIHKFGWGVTLIGVGGIGSAVVLPLVKLGVQELHLYDDDPEIEPHNIPAQMIYRLDDVGRGKLDAIVPNLAPYHDTTCRIVAHCEQVNASTPLEGLVISGVDSMASRQAIWGAVKYNPLVPLYLDGRLGGEQLHLLTVDPNDPTEVENYESEWLFADEEAEDLPCAARTVIGPPIVLAGLLVHQVTLFYRQLPMKRYIDMHLRTTQFVAE